MRTAPPVSSGFGIALGLALGLTATVLSGAAGARSVPIISLVAMVAVVDAIAMVTTARATLATAAVCWALDVGFVLDGNGEPAFTPQAGHAALVLGLCALSALGFASTLRAAHERDHDPGQVSIPPPRQGDSIPHPSG
ncbi:hypothetical protein [Amycolatopsis sp. Hca4]|uniref:hypothetical protein n=1 Tax=Amycolatopsis sp. Hca4 TaxID=2742131 RepID=UPI0015916EFA|nr:hypothetical protein [Amycolatopsis sp. Hca4]QKV73961.1 hypothetical protein HUT10_09395 [Amycolatopsis sp. Hca4]